MFNQAVYTKDRTHPRDAAEFLVSYAMDTVLQIESRIGDIDKPFGIKRRRMGGEPID